MKVALSTLMIQRGKTGVAQYVFNLAKGILQFEPSIKLHLLVLEEDRPLFEFARERARMTIVPEHWRGPAKNILWHQGYLPFWLKENRIDVLHVPSYRRMLAYSPCPQVTTIHDLAPFHVQGKYDFKRMFYGRQVMPQLARRQDRIIAVSQNTALDIEKHLAIPSDRVTVIHNGIDRERYSPGDAREAKKIVQSTWGITEPFFLYVSRLEHPGKNHARLIRAFNGFKQRTGLNWQLVLGGSDWHGAGIIHDEAEKSPCARDIRFLGFVPDDRLPTLYRAASCLIYPSLFEGFGFPPLEAMACDCPVLCSLQGSLREVTNGAAGELDPFDPHNMAGQMIRLATDDFWGEELRKAGRANARRYSWEEVSKLTVEAYASTQADR
jgi:glycosyltransferase involved in cell wall biosynthesis